MNNEAIVNLTLQGPQFSDDIDAQLARDVPATRSASELVFYPKDGDPESILRALVDRSLAISALSCHSDPTVAALHNESNKMDFRFLYKRLLQWLLQ